jgi:hypothetical protein
MGIGSALIMPATLSIITNVFPPSERPKAIGMWAATAGVAGVLGPLAGGFLLEHFYLGLGLPRERPDRRLRARRRGVPHPRLQGPPACPPRPGPSRNREPPIPGPTGVQPGPARANPGRRATALLPSVRDGGAQLAGDGLAHDRGGRPLEIVDADRGAGWGPHDVRQRVS